MQSYVEIQPLFVVNYGNQFEHCWKVSIENNSIYNLNIRNNIYNPIIVYGWEFLQQHYNLSSNVEVLFQYLGSNKMKFISFDIIVHAIHLTRFHSRCLIPNEAKYFEVQLMRNYLHISHMVWS